MRTLNVGDIVCHFKHNLSDFQHDKLNTDYLYKVIDIATDCTTEYLVVVYKELFGAHRCFVRNADEFMSEVDKEKYPDAKQIHRFEIIGHDSIGEFV